MSYPLYIEASEVTLRELGVKFKPVTEERFLYCFQNNTWTIDDVYNFNAQLKISIVYVSKEYERIQALRKVYNLEYPTDHKKYFSTVIELMSKMRSTLSMYKKLMDKFRPKKKGKKQSVASIKLDPTALHSGPYSVGLYGWDNYNDEAVQEMLDYINSFLGYADKIYGEAIAVIEEENSIRMNPDLACPIFEKSYQRSIHDNGKLIEMMKAGNIKIDHDIVKAMEMAEDVRALIASMFHEFTFPDFNYFSVCKAVNDGCKVGLTQEESILFGKDNVEKVIRIRTLLGHILELSKIRDDVIGWEGKIDGCFMMHLLYWCGWDGRKNKALLNYITEHCEGKIGVVEMGTIMYHKRKALTLDNAERYAAQETFNAQMDAFVDSIMNKTPEQGN